MIGQIRSKVDEYEFYYGWLITACCFTVITVIWSVNVSFGVFFDPILTEFDQTRANTSFIFSIQTLTLYVSAAVFGGFVDRYGTRPLLFTGMGLFGLGLFLTSQAQSVTELYAFYGIVTGIGMGILYVIAYTTVPRWFGRRRGTATAIATMGNGIGVLVFPTIASFLIFQFGWQPVYFLTMVVFTVVLGIVGFLIADNPKSFGANLSEEFPNGYVEETLEETWQAQFREVASDIWSVPFALIYVGFGLIWVSVFINYVHLVTYVTDLDMSRYLGVLVLSLMGGTSIPGRFIIGYVADRFGRVSWYIVTGSLMGVLMISLPLLTTPLLLLSFAMCYGFMYGGNGALITPVIADFYGTSNINARYGVMAMSFGVAGFVGPYLAGVSYDILGSYIPVFVGSGLLAIVGSGCILLANQAESITTEQHGLLRG